MIRIMITTRERIWYTVKCIEALEKYTESEFEIFLFDDRSKENLKERYEVYAELVKKNRISELHVLSPNTKTSHNVFGKAFFWNRFGLFSTYGINGFTESLRYFDFILLLDNDIFVKKQNWDKYLIETWKRIDKHPELSKTVKLVTQAPGGIMHPKLEYDLNGYKVRVGSCGGSGFWLIKPSYFQEIGLLPLNYLLNQNKKHDQLSWAILQQKTNSNTYAAGLWMPEGKELALHVGHDHSVCNYLTTGVKAIQKRYKKENKRFKDMDVEDIIKEYNRREHRRW